MNLKFFSYNAALELSATSTDLNFNAQGKTTPPSNVSKTYQWNLLLIN